MAASNNPFTSHLVVTKLLEYSSFNVLKSLRLVNSFFNQLALPILQKKAWVHLNNSNIEGFIKFFRSNDGFIFKNVHLKSISLEFRKPDQEHEPCKPPEEFFLHFGKYIEEIVLEKCSFVQAHDLQKILGHELPNCKVVSISSPIIIPENVDSDAEKLANPESLSGYVNPNVKYLEIIPSIENKKLIEWELLFPMLPNLTSLNVQCRKSADLTDLLHALLNANPQLRNLSEFCCFLTELNESHLNQLTHLNLPWKSLDLNLCPTVPYEKLQELLLCCQKSLKNLKLFHGDLPGASGVTFPMEFGTGFPYGIELSSLTSLELIADMVQSFDFIRFVPNLEKLCVLLSTNNGSGNLDEHGHGHGHAHDDDDDDDDDLSTVAVSNLVENMRRQEGHQGLRTWTPVRHEKLKFLSMEYAMSPESLETLGKQIFPNLRSFSLYLDDDSIRSVFQFMPHLEELAVLGTEVTDEGITGIPMERLLGTSSSSSEIETEREFTYIGNCAKLRKFSLYAQPQENTSDFSVTYGFMRVDSLRSLSLPLTAITDEGIELLQTHPHLVELDCKYFVQDGSVFKREACYRSLGLGNDF